jgi:hypothetical protein
MPFIEAGQPLKPVREVGAWPDPVHGGRAVFLLNRALLEFHSRLPGVVSLQPGEDVGDGFNKQAGEAMFEHQVPDRIVVQAVIRPDLHEPHALPGCDSGANDEAEHVNRLVRHVNVSHNVVPGRPRQPT